MIKFDFNLNIDENFFKEFSEEKTKKVLMKSMFKMESIAIRYAPYNIGTLSQNITLFPQVLSKEYFLVSKVPYSAVMEYGSRPFYAPIKPLKKWAGKKLGDEDIAYAIQKKIAKVGIKAHPFMRPALIQVKGYWLNYFAAIEAKEFK